MWALSRVALSFVFGAETSAPIAWATAASPFTSAGCLAATCTSLEGAERPLPRREELVPFCSGHSQPQADPRVKACQEPTSSNWQLRPHLQ